MRERTERIGFVHIGPEWHGVTRFGRLLERAVPGGPAHRLEIEHGADGSDLDRVGDQHPVVWFAQFTDHLLGRNPTSAAAAIIALAQRLRPGRLVVTLHDLPGPGSSTARREAYRTVAASMSAVVVCSAHERDLLRGCGFAGPVEVIPHFVEGRRAVAARRLRPATAPVVGVLGFLYPGKGHPAILAACARVLGDVRLIALGRPSPGHDHLAGDLVEHGRRLGVGCTVTGWIPEDELDGHLASVDIPVAAHEALSASSSVATWIAAGRRPIVPAGAYMDELLANAPGVVTTYPAGDGAALAACIDAAIAAPASTYHAGVPDRLSVEVIAARYLALA